MCQHTTKRKESESKLVYTRQILVTNKTWALLSHQQYMALHATHSFLIDNQEMMAHITIKLMELTTKMVVKIPQISEMSLSLWPSLDNYVNS